jgi:tetratricopeptide (TPR) repeat protein
VPYKSKLEAAEVKLRAGDFQGAIVDLDDITAQYPDAADVFYAKGLLFGQIGNYELAIENASVAYQKNATLQSLNLLLDLYRATERGEDMINVLRDFRNKNPNLSFVSRELMSTLAGMEKIDDALLVYDEEVSALRSSDTLDVLKAELLTRKGEASAAIKLLKPLDGESAFGPVYSTLSYIYISQHNAKAAIDVLERGLKLSKDPILYLDLADAYREDKKTRPAYEALMMAFDSDQVDFADKHRVMLGLMRQENNEFSSDQVQKLANTLVLRHPRFAESHVIKGNVLWQRGSVEEARSLFMTAVGINPKHLDAWRMLINADISLKLVDEGIMHGREALAANPGNPMLMYFTGLAYLVKEDYEGSRQLLEAALDHSENENGYLRSLIYGTLGDLYHQLKMDAASDVAYDEALLLDSTNVSVLNNYAYYLAVRRKDLDKAEKYSRLSNELDPNSATLQDTYAWVLFQQGRYREALSWIEKALKGDVSAVLLEHYGDILSMVGREKEALKQWERALAIHKGTKEEAAKIEMKIKQRKYVE